LVSQTGQPITGAILQNKSLLFKNLHKKRFYKAKKKKSPKILINSLVFLRKVTCIVRKSYVFNKSSRFVKILDNKRQIINKISVFDDLIHFIVKKI